MIKHHEGVRLRPYLCPAHLWTIGVGHVLYPDQAKLPVKRTENYQGPIRKEYELKPEDNRQWSMDEVTALLHQDLARFERGVPRYLKGELTDGELGAAVSFSFNCGLGTLQRSTFRMKHNRGDKQGAADALMLYVKGGGRVLPGLVKRRKDEIALYLS